MSHTMEVPAGAEPHWNARERFSFPVVLSPVVSATACQVTEPDTPDAVCQCSTTDVSASVVLIQLISAFRIHAEPELLAQSPAAGTASPPMEVPAVPPQNTVNVADDGTVVPVENDPLAWIWYDAPASTSSPGTVMKPSEVRVVVLTVVPEMFASLLALDDLGHDPDSLTQTFT